VWHDVALDEGPARSYNVFIVSIVSKIENPFMSYQIQVQPSGHCFSIEPNEILLDAALRQGLNFPYGCRGGACRACCAKVIAGQVAYLDSTLQKNEHSALAQGEVLCCQAVAYSDLVLHITEVTSAAQIEVRKLPCRIEKMTQLSHDVMQVLLKLPDTERLQFLAGQYIDFVLSNGRHRSFSLANAPHQDNTLELHIRYVPGGEFTTQVFGKLHEKDLLRLEGPHGSFFLHEDSTRPIIFMAGGTGFAPIKSIIEHAIAEGIERPMYLYWGVRAQRDLYLHHLAQAWAAQHAHVHYIPVLSEPLPEDHWHGRTGFVHDAIMQDFSDLSAYEVYACGPPIMVQAGKQAFPHHGLDLRYYYSDAFEFQK
jgi:CDP-4-dehydro-6-deoxyglucose reductase, E3